VGQQNSAVLSSYSFANENGYVSMFGSRVWPVFGQTAENGRKYLLDFLVGKSGNIYKIRGKFGNSPLKNTRDLQTISKGRCCMHCSFASNIRKFRRLSALRPKIHLSRRSHVFLPRRISLTNREIVYETRLYELTSKRANVNISTQDDVYHSRFLEPVFERVWPLALLCGGFVTLPHMRESRAQRLFPFRHVDQ
jgi:hypothetical protein